MNCEKMLGRLRVVQCTYSVLIISALFTYLLAVYIVDRAFGHAGRASLILNHVDSGHHGDESHVVDRPNIVFIVTDDKDVEIGGLVSMTLMPHATAVR